MIRSFASIILIAFAFISHVLADEDRKRKIEIGINPATSSEVDKLSATAFGLSLAHWVEKNENAEALPDGVYKPSFIALNSTFDSQITIWKELSEKEPRHSSYMNALVKVYDAGYIQEYVWIYHNDKNWKKPNGLKLNEFKEWASEYINGHKYRVEARLNLSW